MPSRTSVVRSDRRDIPIPGREEVNRGHDPIASRDQFHSLFTLPARKKLQLQWRRRELQWTIRF